MHFQWFLLWYDQKVTLWAQASDCWCLNITRLTTLPSIHIQEYSKAIPWLVVMEVMYFLRMVSATACASIKYKASATAFQVGFVVLSSQQPNTSVLQRLSSPRWFFSISLSWWRFRSRFTPSVCQSETDLNSFISSFRVGVVEAVWWKKNQSIKLPNTVQRPLNLGPYACTHGSGTPCVLDCSLLAKDRLHYQSLALHKHVCLLKLSSQLWNATDSSNTHSWPKLYTVTLNTYKDTLLAQSYTVTLTTSQGQQSQLSGTSSKC